MTSFPFTMNNDALNLMNGIATSTSDFLDIMNNVHNWTDDVNVVSDPTNMTNITRGLLDVTEAVTDATIDLTDHTDEQLFIGKELATWCLILFGCLLTLSSINGLFGSVLISFTLLTDKQFRNESATYTINMASLVATDVYFQAYYFPLMVLDFALGYHPVVNDVHCVVTSFCASVCYIVFLMTLLAISMDRYLRVCHYTTYRKLVTKKSSACACVALWVIGTVATIPAAMDGSLGFNVYAHVCVTPLTEEGNYFDRLMFGCALVTLPGIGISNLLIFRTYRQSRNRIRQWPRNQGQGQIHGQGQRQRGQGEEGRMESESETEPGPRTTRRASKRQMPGTGLRGQGQNRQGQGQERPAVSDQESVEPESSRSRSPSVPCHSQAGHPQGQGHALGQWLSNERLRTVSSSDIALLRSLLVVVLCLLVFFLPSMVIAPLRLHVHVPYEVYVFCFWLLSVNSSVTWIVYGLMNTRFKLGYKRALSACKRFRMDTRGR